MSTNRVKVQTESQSRSAIYGFIAWLFLKQPDVEFVTQLLSDDIQDSLAILPFRSESTYKIIAGLKQMRSSLLESGPRTLEDLSLALAVEHTRFLQGVGRAYSLPPPYESLYRSSEAGEDNAFLLQLTEFYRQAQAAIQTESVERVDYLGIELDLMRLLCEEESHAINQQDTAQAAHFSHLQQRFLHEHLLVWAPRFCESFIAQTTDGFYHGVAQLLLGFLDAETTIGADLQAKHQQLTGSTGQVLEK
jgi:TorA maturation chaperone TorD